MSDVRSSISINAPHAAVLRAFTNLSDLKRWWGVQKGLIVPEVGGNYCLSWQVSDGGTRFLTSGVISELTGSKLVVKNVVYFNSQRSILGPMTLEVSVKEQKHYTHLQIKQTGYPDTKDGKWLHDATKDAWPSLLEELRMYLEAEDEE